MSTEGPGTRLSENISYSRSPQASWLRDFLINVSIYQGGSLRHVHRTIGRRREDGPGRQRKQEGDCLEISVMYGRAAPLGFGIFLIRVSIYKGGSVSPGISNYREPNAKRARSTAETGTRLSKNISYVWSPHATSFWDFPDQCKNLPGGLFRLIHRIIGRRGKRGRSAAVKGDRLSEISDMSARAIPLVSWLCMVRVIIYHIVDVAPYTSNYMIPKKNAPDRHREQELDCREIPPTLRQSIPVGFGILLIRVSICQGGSVSLGTSNYRMPKAKRARSTAETGDRLYGNISYVFSVRPGRFSAFS